MFYNDTDEDFIVNVLRAFVEEFGAAQCVVSVPEAWKDFGYSLGGRVALLFATKDEITIAVPFWDVQRSIKVRVRTTV